MIAEGLPRWMLTFSCWLLLLSSSLSELSLPLFVLDRGPVWSHKFEGFLKVFWLLFLSFLVGSE